MQNKYSEFLAEKWQVPTDRVSFARTERSDEETAANTYQDGAYKAQVSLNNEKREQVSVGGLRIAI